MFDKILLWLGAATVVLATSVVGVNAQPDSRWDGFSVGAGYAHARQVVDIEDGEVDFDGTAHGVSASAVYWQSIQGGPVHLGLDANLVASFHDEQENCGRRGLIRFQCDAGDAYTLTIGARAGYDFDFAMPYLHAGGGVHHYVYDVETSLTWLGNTVSRTDGADVTTAAFRIGAGAMVPITENIGLDLSYSRLFVVEQSGEAVGQDYDVQADADVVQANVVWTF